MQKTKNRIILILSIFYLFATVSAKYSFIIDEMYSSMIKYGLAALLIMVTFTTAIQPEFERRRLGQYIQYEWIFLFVYGLLLVLQYQVFSSSNRLIFGISMGIANAMQKLAMVFIGCYILKKGDKNFCLAIIISFMLIILLDAINTIQAVQINDQALREATINSNDAMIEDSDIVGIANVNHIFSYITCVPIIFMLLVHQKAVVPKLLTIGVLIMIIVSTVNAGFTMALTIMMVAIFVLITNSISSKPAVRIMFAIIIIFLVFVIDWAEIVLFIGTKISNLTVKERLADIYSFLEYGSSGDTLSSRTEGYVRGLEGFLQSPIIGNIILDTRKTSGHSTVIDIMSNWGIIGISMYLGYIINMFRASIFFTLKKDSLYIIVAGILYMLSLVVNPIGNYVHSVAVIGVFLAAAGKYIYINEQSKNENSEEEIVKEDEIDKKTFKSCIR